MSRRRRIATGADGAFRPSAAAQLSTFKATLTNQLSVQPDLCGAPVAPDGDRRNLEHHRRLLDREAAEKAHLDDLDLSGVDAGESVQGIIESDEVDGRVVAHDGGFVQRDMLDAASTFEVVPSRSLHENATHQLRRDGEEVRSILPPHPLVVDQPDVGLIDQRGRLEAVVGSLAPHVPVGEPTEFGIHDGRQRVERSVVPVAPRTEKRTDVAPDRFISALAAIHWAELYGPSCTVAGASLGRGWRST